MKLMLTGDSEQGRGMSCVSPVMDGIFSHSPSGGCFHVAYTVQSHVPFNTGMPGICNVF